MTSYNPVNIIIDQYDFNSNLLHNVTSNHYIKDLWPIVYIISDDNKMEAYVGETTDTLTRMSTHLKNNTKSKLTSVRLISSDKFNKSATLDIESNLIKYMDADGRYSLQNGNLGLANHNYYQKKEIYWEVFNTIWNKLRAEGITKHSIEYINNSDLFKYSPYKSLSKDQTLSLLKMLEALNDDTIKTTIVEGGAGTGKTILAVFLFKILNVDFEGYSFKEFGEDEQRFIELINSIKNKKPALKMALVVPMASFRATIKKVFKNIKGLSSSMVIGPADLAKQKFDIVVVDESHRLRRRVNLGAYYGAFDKACEKLNLNKFECSELHWVKMQSEKSILFYDAGQSIKPSDAKKEDFANIIGEKTSVVQRLTSQFRVKGGNSYVEFTKSLLNCSLQKGNGIFEPKDYELFLFDSLEEMIKEVKQRERENGLSRLIAGYSWEWISNKNKSAFDIQIDNIKLKWNGTANDWINSPESINEVGCIHTTQGYDLNYAGIIFGNEISYDKTTNEIIIKPENYYDKNGKQSIKDPTELKQFIINIYQTILLRGIKGTYIYACDPALREYFKIHLPTKNMERKESIVVNINETKPYIDSVPLYDLKVAAGEFGHQQIAEIVNWVKLPQHIKPSKDLFACRVIGESMNKIIPNGSICLFRKYSGGSRNGQIVLAECINYQDADFGGTYTIKEYESKKTEDENGWKHTSITLKPLSSIKSYENIELKDEALESFKVIGIFEYVLQ